MSITMASSALLAIFLGVVLPGDCADTCEGAPDCVAQASVQGTSMLAINSVATKLNATLATEYGTNTVATSMLPAVSDKCKCSTIDSLADSLAAAVAAAATKVDEWRCLSISVCRLACGPFSSRRRQESWNPQLGLKAGDHASWRPLENGRCIMTMEQIVGHFYKQTNSFVDCPQSCCDGQQCPAESPGNNGGGGGSSNHNNNNYGGGDSARLSSDVQLIFNELGNTKNDLDNTREDLMAIINEQADQLDVLKHGQERLENSITAKNLKVELAAELSDAAGDLAKQIQKGDTGPRGEKGDQGPQGEKGEACIKLRIGDHHNRDAEKIVELSTEGYTCPAEVNKGNWLNGGHEKDYGDRFQVERVEGTRGKKLKVTRVDNNDVTWGMKVEVMCCLDFNFNPLP